MKSYVTEMEITRPPFLGGGSWKLSGLTPIVVVFGKNGSGKSKLLRAWRDANTAATHYVVPERAGELDYQPQFLQQQLNPTERQNVTGRNFAGEYRRHVVARINSYFAARGNHRGGTLPGDPAELEALVGTLLPDFTTTFDGLENPPFKLIRTHDETRIGNVDELSSGETQIFTLALDILTIVGIWDIQKAPERIILIDEPDAHIHPDLQVRFADFLIAVAKLFELQVVVSTHSTTLLAALGQFGAKDASVLYLDRTKDTFKTEPFTDLLRELAACLGGHALMGPLFGVPLLLVEGDDDYRIWSQVPRYHAVNFSVIPAGGDEIKNYQRALEKVFGSLREQEVTSSGFALIDGDKGKPSPDTVPQKHIRYIQLACHESENLYLADEVLALLGIDWPTAQNMIVEAAPGYGQKQAKLEEVRTWDRQTADIKDVIEQLSLILDPKKVHWTLRVAKAIGTTRPTGQVSEFLGSEVIVALWGEVPPAEDPVTEGDVTPETV